MDATPFLNFELMMILYILHTMITLVLCQCCHLWFLWCIMLPCKCKPSFYVLLAMPLYYVSRYPYQILHPTLKIFQMYFILDATLSYRSKLGIPIWFNFLCDVMPFCAFAFMRLVVHQFSIQTRISLGHVCTVENEYYASLLLLLTVLSTH